MKNSVCKLALAAALSICATAGAAGSATAGTNILPNSGATVTGSTIHDGFSTSVSGENLVNGTLTPSYGLNGDPRWVFADNSAVAQVLLVALNTVSGIDIDSAGFTFSQDRTPTTYQILTSFDDSTFTVVGSGVIPAGSSGNITVDFGKTLAKYVEYNFGQYSISACSGCGGGVDQGAAISQLNVGVPEPATWAMLMIGVLAVGGAFRMNRRTNEIVA